MSTNDVPGAKPGNRDELATGCWAEHEDGSMIFVESTEGGSVVFSMFDTRTEPLTEYRHRMPERGFKTQFSWKPDDPDSEQWTWHDKTPFPWDRIIKEGARPGMRHPSADDTLSAAERVARSMGVHGVERERTDYSHLATIVGDVAKKIVEGVQDAIKGLRR